jgi:two-component system response regulator FlrC
MNQKPTILIVEDEPDIRSVMQESLESLGLSILTAANGQEALGKLEKNPGVSLILLDLMMPVMNGWQFLSAIDKNPVLKKIPIIVVTVFSDQAKDLKVRGVIKKPFDLDDLLKQVNEMLRVTAISHQ